MAFGTVVAIYNGMIANQTINLKDVFTLQSYIDEGIVSEKINSDDYKIQVALIDDDGVDVAILVDGHHSLAAAKRMGKIPQIEIVENFAEKTLVRYVEAFRDLSNPVNIVTGKDLW